MTPKTHPALWSFLFGNLIIGTGIMLPAGLLNVFMADLGLDAPTAGLLSFVGGLVVGIGAPLVAALTSSIDRRILLTTALMLYVVGHIGAAMAPTYTLVLVFRAVTVAGAAIFTPQAAATVGLIVPPERRGAAIAFIFIGWSLASVLGIPLGALLGDVIGWRGTYLCMAGLSALGVVGVFVTTPKGLRVAPLRLSSWVQVLTDWRLLLVLAVTLLVGSGQTAVFIYMTPLLTTIYAASTAQIALTFLAGGTFGVLGNIAVARFATRIGPERGAMASMIIVLLAMGLITVFFGNYWVLLGAVCLWQIGGFAVNSFQQGRLVALAPALASATVAMNTSVVYLGQAVGAKTGGHLVRDAFTPSLPGAAMGFVVIAMILSAIAAHNRPRG